MLWSPVQVWKKPGLQYLIDQTVDYIIKDRCGCFFMAPLVAKTSLWETDPTPAWFITSDDLFWCSDVYGLSVWFQVFSVINWSAFLYCAAIKSKIYDKAGFGQRRGFLVIDSSPLAAHTQFKKIKRQSRWMMLGYSDIPAATLLQLWVALDWETSLIDWPPAWRPPWSRGCPSWRTQWFASQEATQTTCPAALSRGHLIDQNTERKECLMLPLRIFYQV